MLQSGLFDLEDRFGKLDQLGDPLKALNEVVDWSAFGPILTKGLQKEKKSNAGRPGLIRCSCSRRSSCKASITSPFARPSSRSATASRSCVS